MIDPAMVDAHLAIEHDLRWGDRSQLSRYIFLRRKVEREIAPPMERLERFGYTRESFLDTQRGSLARLEAECPDLKPAYEALQKRRPPTPSLEDL